MELYAAACLPPSPPLPPFGGVEHASCNFRQTCGENLREARGQSEYPATSGPILLIKFVLNEKVGYHEVRQTYFAFVAGSWLPALVIKRYAAVATIQEDLTVQHEAVHPRPSSVC